MKSIVDIIQNGVREGVKALYGADIDASDIAISGTRKEFEGDFTVVVFPFTRLARKKPEEIGQELGQYLLAHSAHLDAFNVIKGFLNLGVSPRYWTSFLDAIYQDEHYGQRPPTGKRVMVEYCSPNTNKPLHLGHIRNILLGWSTSRIMEAAGNEVVRVQIVNDRGIAICKSMLAWQKFGGGSTPESTRKKGDHFVGDYYVLFERKFQEEYQAWQSTREARDLYESRRDNGQAPEDFFKDFRQTYFNEYSRFGAEARAMLLNWESGDPATVALWKTMNGWVYDGFEATYRELDVTFDKLYFESNTYLLGKDLIDQGLEKGIFFRKEDGSVWVDLSDAKLDQKILLRSDGTSVYITQDLGTAHQRYLDFGVDRMIYVVGDEQNYHFQVLFEVLKRLGEPYADGLHHLSYGMVDLPTGKMKSREGTVVDADDLIAEVIGEARQNSADRGALADLSADAQEAAIRQIGLAALKFFIIKVHPKKRMIFDPKESVDLQGQTGPYVQNAYVRVRSVQRKAGREALTAPDSYEQLEAVEKEILLQLYDFPNQIQLAAQELDPSAIANFCYTLAKSFHRFYHDHSILNAETEAARVFRIKLSQAVAHVLRFGMDLLGIEMPEKM